METNNPEMLDPIDITMIEDENIEAFSHFIPEKYRVMIAVKLLLAMGAVVDGKAVGAIVWDVMDDDSVELLSIYVAPGYRRQYIGSTLFCQMVDFLEGKIGMAVNGVKVQYADNGSGTKTFFDALRFIQTKGDETTIDIAVSDLVKCDFVKQPMNAPKNITIFPVGSISSEQLEAVNSVINAEDGGFLGYPLSLKTNLADISYVAFSGNEPIGAVGFSGNKESVTMTTFFFLNKTPSLPIALLQAAVSALSENYGSAVASIPIVEESARKLTEKLLGGYGKTVETMYTAVFECV